MDPVMPTNVPDSLVVVAGLIQLALFVWLFVFPSLIIKKLNEIAALLKKE